MKRATRMGAVACAAATLMLLLVACGKGGGNATSSSTPPVAAVPKGAEEVQRAGAEAAALAALAKRPTDWPALSGQVLAELAADTPELQSRLPALEAGERAAMKQVMDEALAKLAPAAPPTARRAPGGAIVPRMAIATPRARGAVSPLDWFIAPAGAADAGLTVDQLRTVVVGHLLTTFLGGVADGGRGEPGTEALRSEYTEKTGEKASFVVKTEKDSQLTTELDTEIAVPIFLVEANSRVSITTRGLCPDISGKVEFTVRMNSGGQRGGGRNMAYDHTREAHVTATVNDDAEIADADIDTQYGDRSTAGGKQTYAGASTSWTVPGGEVGKLRVISYGNERLSSQATSADRERMVQGATNALLLGIAALEGAKQRWQGGACIRLIASSPGAVKPKAESRIPVSVKHRLDGSDIPAKVKVELTGGESVDPTLIPRAPGTLTHKAPDAKSAQMSIKLTARSKRGMAEETLKLSINEDAYNASGGAGDFHGTGLICSLSAPFKISGSGVTVSFTPSSDQGGTYTYNGNIAGFHLHGNGTYRVIYRDGSPAEIFATGPGAVNDSMGSGDEHYQLTPAKDAACATTG